MEEKENTNTNKVLHSSTSNPEGLQVNGNSNTSRTNGGESLPVILSVISVIVVAVVIGVIILVVWKKRRSTATVKDEEANREEIPMTRDMKTSSMGSDGCEDGDETDEDIRPEDKLLAPSSPQHIGMIDGGPAEPPPTDKGTRPGDKVPDSSSPQHDFVIDGGPAQPPPSDLPGRELTSAASNVRTDVKRKAKRKRELIGADSSNTEEITETSNKNMDTVDETDASTPKSEFKQKKRERILTS